MGFVDPPLALVARGRDLPRGGAQRARPRCCCRRSPTRSAHSPSSSGREHAGRRIEGTVRAAGGPLRRGGAQPAAVGVLGAARAHRRCSSRDDPHLGLYGAFGYDLAFQFEPIRLRLDAAGRPARPGALPARRADRRRPPARARHAAPLRVRGRRRDRPAACRATAPSGPYVGAATRSRARRPRARASTPPGRARRRRVVQARRPVRGGARPDLLRALPDAAVGAVPPPARAQPGALRLPDQPGRGRVPGRRLARRCTSASTATASRPARSPARSRAARDPIEDAAQIRTLLNSAQGRVRADDVHRRRPQRQVAHLRAGQRAGDRPPADRDVLAADPHRRPRRGPPARRASTRSTPSSPTRGR